MQPWLKSELLAASPPTSERFEFPPAPACSVPGVCAVGSSGSGRWAHCHVGILTLLSSVQSLPVDPGGITMKQSQDQLLLSAGQRALGFTVFSTKQDGSCAQSGVYGPHVTAPCHLLSAAASSGTSWSGSPIFSYLLLDISILLWKLQGCRCWDLALVLCHLLTALSVPCSPSLTATTASTSTSCLGSTRFSSPWWPGCCCCYL